MITANKTCTLVGMLERLIVIGINHDSASVAIRERVAFAPEKVSHALSSAVATTEASEIVILSTCNRTEMYVYLPGLEQVAEAENSLIAWLADYHALSLSDLYTCTYRLHGRDAFTHLVRVASGLNSMVLGEPQIFGQLKSAFAVAAEAGAVGDHFNQLFPEAFRIAKRVRTDTAIGENPVSVAFASVDLARHIFSDLSACKALLIGAGETIELVARHLREANLGGLMIANRTLERAESLATQFTAEAIMLADVPDRLAEADLIISSTGSQLPILGKGAVEAALRKRRWRPMLLIDLAVPRDIEPQVADISDAFLYSVDDLRDVIEENLRLRASEASKADEIVGAGITQLEADLKARRSADVVRSYRDSALAVQQQELERALKMLAKGEDPETVLRRLARDLTNKLIHAPTTGLRQMAREGDLSSVSRVAALLGLDTPDPERDEKTTLQ
jgi:glutamyl-tRNA reductase